MSDTAALLFMDLSSNNAIPNLKQYSDAGHRILVLKATEGTSYVWQQGDALAAQWRVMGKDHVVVRYDFARPGVSGVAQADFMLAHMFPEDICVLDLEGSGWAPGEANREMQDFCARIEAKRGWTGGIYSGSYFLSGQQVKFRPGWFFWLAAYQDHLPPMPPGWPQPAWWQYTDAAQVPGEPGRVDESRALFNPIPGHINPAEDGLMAGEADKILAELKSLGAVLVGKPNPDGTDADPTHVGLYDLARGINAVSAAVKALQADVDTLKVGGGTIDYKALAKAVNDDAAARLKE